MHARAAIPVLLCLLAVAGTATGQDGPSTRERAWAGAVSKALGGSRTGVPAKVDGRLSVTVGDTRVTRERAASPAAALERARTLLTGASGASQVVDVRGRQLVIVEATSANREGLRAILDAAWGTLPGGDDRRTAISLRRGSGVAALAMDAGALRAEAEARFERLGTSGGARLVGSSVVHQGVNQLEAARLGERDGAFASAAHSTAMRSLLSAFSALGAAHGLTVDAPRASAPEGVGRRQARDASVSGAAPASTERSDLTGTWSVHDQDDGPTAPGGSPDLVRFSRRVAGEPDTYDLVFITAAGRINGRATFDGRALVVERTPEAVPTPPGTSVGYTRVIEATTTGRPVARPAAAAARTPAAAADLGPGRYTLSASARELEFTVVGEATPDSNAPVHAFRRLAEPTVVCPGEWEASDEILWAAVDAFREYALVGVYAAALRSTTGVTHRIFVTSSADELYLETELASVLGEAHVDRMDALETVVRSGGDGVWMRDYGPITVRKKSDGSRLAGDMGYYSDRPSDDALPAEYAATRGWDVIDLQRLKLEGGNFMSDGRGKIYVTGRALEGSRRTSSAPGGANDSQRAVEDALFELGAREVCWVPRMTHADGTGHIDMFSKLLDANTVLVGRDTNGPHAAMLEDAAQRFEALGLRVERVDMAKNPTVAAEALDLQTYTNALFVGRIAIVPQYDMPETDRAALAVYRRAGYTAVGADVRAVIAANGAIHCVSMQVPR